jgi:hypothetical protein
VVGLLQQMGQMGHPAPPPAGGRGAPRDSKAWRRQMRHMEVRKAGAGLLQQQCLACWQVGCLARDSKRVQCSSRQK